MELGLMRRTRRLKRVALLMLAVYGLSLAPSMGHAGGPSIPGLKGTGITIPAPPPNATPVPRGAALPVPAGVFPGVSSIEKPTENSLVIHQDQPKAIIDWESFDIGKNASTHFDQRGHADWAALNRIWDQNPSRIFGKLTADGKVYLINQNGILFGPDSKVDVHTLAASSLNLRDEDFLANRIKLKAENYQQPGEPLDNSAFVANQGSIQTAKGGAVFLVAPTVENSGSVLSPAGQIGMAAGSQVEIAPDTATNSTRSALVVNVQEGAGEVSNREGAELIADNGLVGMYGRVVNQEGLARAVTAAKKPGKIEFFASELISTGPKSVTATPVSDSMERVHQSFEFQGGEIRFQGLDPNRPLSPQTPVARIEHRGVIQAPAGTVRLEAAERVFLENGSLIDVAGLWVERPAEAQLVTAQLNSVELRDDHGQKSGILRGQTIQVSGLLGSSIGDISGSLTSQELRAVEQAVKGGQISITAQSGDIILKEGASLDFSGGGFRYESGHLDTTHLLAGTRVYDISSAPQWLRYDAILDSQSRLYERFGLVETYEGLYFGGAVPVRGYAVGHTEGHDAGTLTLIARSLVLDGGLDGSVVRGLFQTLPSEPVDSLGLQTARGLREPRGGSLVVGNRPLALASPETQDFGTEALIISGSVATLPFSFGPQDPIPATYGITPSGVPVTAISADTLTAAGLGSLEVFANTTIRLESDAHIRLNPGGQFAAAARRIEQYGQIQAPSGAVSLLLRDNLTSFDRVNLEQNPRFIPLQSRIYLAEGSLLDVSGQRVDNSHAELARRSDMVLAHTAGGSVMLDVGTADGDGVILARGSRLEVSGGWEIDPTGKITGGNAGTLSLMGPSLILDGELRGHALPGQTAGKIVLHAHNVWVLQEAPELPQGFGPDWEIPPEFENKLLLAQNLLDLAGFSRIELVSSNDVRLEEGVSLKPSLARLAAPVPSGPYGLSAQSSGYQSAAVPGARGILTVSPDLAGATSIVARAGQALGGGASLNEEALVWVAPRASLSVAPGGEIRLEGPGIDMAGVLEAPAGKVGLTATLNDLVVRDGGSILARGYLKPSSKAPASGAPIEFTPLAGGSVRLEARNGDLVLAAGSLVDVSGSAPTTWTQKNPDGTFSSHQVASDPGSIELRFLGSLILEGELMGRGQLEGLRGGSLSIRRTNTLEGLSIAAQDLSTPQSLGFDALTFSSWRGLEFSGPMDAQVGRSLTLDAPEILGSGQGRIALSAPWIRLINTYYPASASPTSGDAQLSLTGGFLDVEGNVSLSGFSQVRLEAQEDIRLFDRLCQLSGQADRWSGQLQTPGDLTLRATRIYPTTLSNFTIRSGGKVTTLPGTGDTQTPIFSAGGSLAIEAAAIEHRGFLAAPMGQISLLGTAPDSRIYLAEGSLLTTAGNAQVSYGALEGLFWTTTDKRTFLTQDVSSAPAKGISIQGAEVIAMEGASLDASGGGSIFAYQFLPGIEGSVNPLQVRGRYVIVPDGSVKLPEEAVYLSGIRGLPAGVYSLLPEQYAFLPGALVIQDLGVSNVSGYDRSTEGYPVTTGYFTVMGTDVGAAAVRAFSVRPAKEVLREGHFTMKSLASGEGGTVSIQGQSTILNSSILAAGLPDFPGGTLALSGQNVLVGQTGASLPQGFDFSTPLPAELRGTLLLDASGLSGHGLSGLLLGDLSVTDTVTLLGGSLLEATSITLAARNSISLQEGAQIRATGPGGKASLLSPAGTVSLAQGSVLHAADSINLDASSLNVEGRILVDHSTLNLASDRIFIVPGSYTGSTTEGLYITEALWGTFANIENIGLMGRTDLTFLGSVDLAVGQSLTINTPRIAGVALDGALNVTLTSPEVRFLNTGSGSSNTGLADSGLLSVSSQQLSVGRGSVLLDGFGQVSLTADKDLTFLGVGSFLSSGDLAMNAARITTSYYSDGATPYEAANFTVDAGNRSLFIGPGRGSAGETATPGGRLELLGRALEVWGTIQLNSGQVVLRATGSGPEDSVRVRGGGRILARGSDFAPGGTITLSSNAGEAVLEAGALLDVSAGPQGDAGMIRLMAPVGGVRLSPAPPGSATLAGATQGGQGGSFLLDTNQLGDFASLNGLLSSGGFHGALDIRVRSGDVSIGAADTVRARWLRLSADAGSIDLWGTLDVSGLEGGGRVALYAGQNLSVQGGGAILARGLGSGAPGGEILLGAVNGNVSLNPAGLIDVSGGASGAGGSFSLRAQRLGNDLRVNLNGTIRGASSVFVEAFRTYQDNNINTSDLTAWRNDSQAFMNNAGVIEARLLAGLTREGWESPQLHLIPGIQVLSAGDLTLANDWDLTNWRFGGEPGALTLRAAGNLNMNANLVDHPTAINSLPGSAGRDSWALSLVAGADLASADPMAVMRGVGDLRIADGKMAYTESAPLQFASGRDTLIGPGNPTGYMIRSAIRYSLGSFDGDIWGLVGRDLSIRGGAIQSATGDITVQVGRDLILQVAQDFGSSGSFTSLGSIRTTGQQTTGVSNFWDYAGGGDILLRVGGSVTGALASNAWDFAYGTRPPRRWAASFENHNATEGLATMGGGDLTVLAGGSFYGQAGTFGTGDLSILAGGDLDGRFLVKAGTARLHAMGNFGTRLANSPIEAFDARIDISAQGNIALGSVVNPTIAREGFVGFWNLGYTPETSVRLTAITGQVALYGDSAFYNLGASISNLERILPASLEISAGGDIRLFNDFALAPSPTGSLSLLAGGDIDGQYLFSMGNQTSLRRASITMSDVAPGRVYGDQGRTVNASLLFSPYEHDPSLLHFGDPNPVEIRAGGDIRNLALLLPKRAEITAGQDIRDIYYFGQNVAEGDVSLIRAGRDILFSSVAGSSFQTGMEHAGPGYLMVQAGNNLDLGTTRGVTTTGNANNPSLGTQGSTIMVMAGYDKLWTPSELESFFSRLQEAGKQYSQLLAEGDLSGAQAQVEEIRGAIIGPFLEGAAEGQGRIEMVRSQMSTASGGDIFVVTAGAMNVGVSTLTTEAERENTGINTMSGGAIRIFAVGDVNVNESRVMTFLGGDILIWSDQGDVNAGRGAKTAVNTSRPVRVNVGTADNPIWVLQRRPVAVGSGVRTLTYDPDGVEGPMEEPLAGDVYIFAPEGIIDAGEAGIAGRNVFLGATAILNAQNISFSAGSVGVPLSTESGPGLGVLTGTSSLAEASKTMEQTASMTAAERSFSKEEAAKLAETMMAKWVRVEFIGYEEEDEESRRKKQ
jgi:filamentous hemagglutinin